ncbi:uncharacterized protein CC84DRAFT_1186292 [Paraphaeosphaeria sporulosa]|uniref:C2H2-type domain-containing protein n=1 Tax=Paraphaeosphaeria sporulosa TaxID=1460663 RepID=A0A177CIE6_9PLEO|nr:uncharacterized protein CC84DRAFT_1186292 [Paraphaeosphaeria sporulosa]OAG07285.1 hypothetical protein CC84DRAFT_1186292 [Paraphaeosphaeria sporulosa]
MLALPQRRQHLPQTHSSATLPSPTSPQQLSFDQLSQQLSAQQLYDQKLLNDYIESQRTFADSNITVDGVSNSFMTGAYDFNPSIRIQQSTPTPQLPAAYPPSMNATGATINNNWNAFQNMSGNTQSLQAPAQSRTGKTHQRASSSSSVGSAGSQYQTVGPTASYPYVALSENLPSSSALLDSSNKADEYLRAFSTVSNHLPTPTHTPTQDSFMGSHSFNNYTPTSTGMDSTMAAHMSMKQALMDQHVPDEDVPGFAHSARQSVSSYGHDSPATPHTSHGDDLDFKIPPNGEPLRKVDSWLFNQFIAYDDDVDLRPVPKFERTYTDVAADYSFDPTSVTQTQSIPQAKPVANALLSPWRNSNPNDIVQRSLQAAQMARSQSPSSTASRGDSPFRRGSPYRQPTNSFNSPRGGVGTAAAAREQKVEADAAYAMKSRIQSNEEAVKTISPKDALLDYREADDESKVPLFPDGGASEYDHQYNGGDQYRNATQSTFDTTSGQSYRRDSWATPQFSANFPASSAGTSQPSSTFAFAAPSLQTNYTDMSTFAPTSQYRTASSMQGPPDSTPEFPAHLTSMESSASEAGLEPGSQSSDRLVKPADSSADSGTYTCTYHGCTQRFETPQKLQKHKREGHRSSATTMGSSMTSAALLERNSQAGPHKCERINPTTGKPCNTIFSRPYDLTRHEDTIHNARKQKVRCALCVEEKTFSRNDALTRHMRVVHPEVDFPGKHRRRGGNHD